MIKHVEYTNDHLQNEAVDLLKELGADKSKVWLVEVQNYDQFKRIYGKAAADDYLILRTNSLFTTMSLGIFTLTVYLM